MGTNCKRIRDEVRARLVEFNVSNAEEFEENVNAFLNQCPEDVILEDAKVMWNNDGNFTISWDTDNLDCIFSIGLDEIGWRIWVGVNNHKIEEECLLEGVGGDKIVDNDFNAEVFFDQMRHLLCK